MDLLVLCVCVCGFLIIIIFLNLCSHSYVEANEQTELTNKREIDL